ncbi:MAG: Electron transfer flavoprotein-ubiquinone oxidoreductase [bacterium]|nr:Electron transfer flavoprotein-ubiquinone oxidoreductase [bacterium]
MAAPFVPARFQAPLPQSHFIVEEAPNEEALPMDVLIVGGGPAGLACAIRLKQLCASDPALGDLEIGVLEKAPDLGGHCLSGAVMNPVALKSLFPDLPESELPLRTRVDSEAVYLLTGSGQFKIPTPPTMANHGNYVVSLCEVVQWLGSQAEALGINLFPGYPAESLLVQGTAVVGARTVPVGLDRSGVPTDNYTPPTDVTARVTVLAEGTRGPLAQAYCQWQGLTSTNPQIFALGVKELWEVKAAPKQVIHTLGWPLPTDAFGGSWLYPMADNLVSLGLVVGLDYRQQQLDVHNMLQHLKRHPLIAPILEGGQLVEWGAKTIPEGGWHSLPTRLHGEGLLMAGDTVGMVNVPALKGIHLAMQAGIFAAETIAAALKQDDTTAAALSSYDTRVKESFIGQDMYATRNMRLAFKDGFYLGGFQAVLMTLTKGGFPGGTIAMHADADASRREGAPCSALPEGGMSKLDAVFYSGNQTRDDIPSHLIVGQDIPGEVADFYAAMCPAGVYERQGDALVVNAPNCIDCKATDVLGPRWTPREGGSGPSYKRM